MKFAFTTLFFTIGAALADTVGLMVTLDNDFYGEMACFSNQGDDNRLYPCNDFDFRMFLEPITDSDSGLTVLATVAQPTRYVNVDSEGFLVLDDKGYGFNDTFERPNLQNVSINDIETFYLVQIGSGDSVRYDIKVLEEAPEGGIPVTFGEIGVATIIKKNKLGQELHFNKFIKRG